MVRGCAACAFVREGANGQPSRPSAVYLRRRNRVADGSSSSIPNEQEILGDSSLPEILRVPLTGQRPFLRRKFKTSGCLFCSMSPEPPVVVGPRGDEPTGLSLTLTDSSVLYCGICLDILCSPVFQCENGHIACSLCCIKIKKKCAYCRLPIGTIRCRVLEQLLSENLKFPCAYMKQGCKKKLPYSDKEDHEKACKYAPPC